MKSMQSQARSTVKVSPGNPRNRTGRDPHPQHHTPKPQPPEVKAQKGISRQRNKINRLIRQGEKSSKVKQALNVLFRQIGNN